MLRLHTNWDGSLFPDALLSCVLPFWVGIKFKLCGCKVEKESLDNNSLLAIEHNIPKGCWFLYYFHGTEERILYVIAVCKNRFHMNIVTCDVHIKSNRQRYVSIGLVTFDNDDK